MTSMTCHKVRGLHHRAGPHLGGEKQRNQLPGEQEVPRGGSRPDPGEYSRRGPQLFQGLVGSLVIESLIGVIPLFIDISNHVHFDRYFCLLW